MSSMAQAGHLFHTSSDRAVAQQFCDSVHGSKPLQNLVWRVLSISLPLAPSIFISDHRSQKAFVLSLYFYFVCLFILNLFIVFL